MNKETSSLDKYKQVMESKKLMEYKQLPRVYWVHYEKIE